MPTTTANLGLTLPTPNVDTGWGSTLNTDFTTIDNLFASNGTGTSVGLQVGSGKTLVLGGTMVLGAGDGTGSVTAPTIRGAARTGTNVGGVALTIDAPNGTGTGGSGNIILRTAPSGASGTTANTMQNAFIVTSDGNVTVAGESVNTLRYLDVTNPNTGANAGGIFRLITSNVAGSGVATVDIAKYKNGAFVIANNETNPSAVTTFYVANTECIRIGNAGQIGFGGANFGVSGQVLTSNGSAASPSWAAPTINQVATQTFSASGVSFTNIPATAKTIIMTVSGLDPDGSADVLVRIGTSSGFATTSYVSSGSAITSAGANTSTSTAGFFINLSGSSGSGSIRLTSLGSNVWVCDHSLGTNITKTCVGGGTITLAAALDRVQIVPATGTLAATGTVNIMYL